MDQVDLPLLDADDLVEAAIDSMNAMDRRFIIVRFEQDIYRSFSNKEVLWGWANNYVTLRTLPGGQAVANVQLASSATASHILTLSYDDPKRQIVYTALESSGSDFGITGLPQTLDVQIDVISRKEDFAHAARSTTKECICKFDNTHNGRCPPNPSDGNCPVCSRNTWRCA